MLPVCLRPDREAQGRALPKKCLQGKEDVHWPGDCLIFSTGRPRQGDINHGWRQQEGAGKTTVAQREDNIHYQSGRTFCDIRLPSESHARSQMKLIAFLKLHYFLEWLYILEISSFFCSLPDMIADLQNGHFTAQYFFSNLRDTKKWKKKDA